MEARRFEQEDEERRREERAEDSELGVEGNKSSEALVGNGEGSAMVRS